jgi:hypothetical protein
MVKAKIELRKIRDFGENFNDTFQFIRQEFKPLLLTFLAISGIFILGQSIFSGIYQKDSFSVFDDLINGRTVKQNANNPFDNMFGFSYAMLVLFGLLAMTSMKVVVAAYFKMYQQKGNETPSIEEVWQVFIRYFFQIFFFDILLWLMIIIGSIFCLAPGVYFMVVFTAFEMIVVIEEIAVSDAFSRCFQIVKENFWISLAIYLVAYLIYSFSSGIIGLVVSVIAGAISYLTTKEIGTTLTVVTSVLNVFGFIFYLIFAVSLGLHYYNLVEQLDGTGMIDRIDSIGNASATSTIEEQY